MPEASRTRSNDRGGKGRQPELAKEPKELDGGFILVYGGVEENCSFKALISAKKDELADKVHQLIFA